MNDYYIGNTRIVIHTDKCTYAEDEIDRILENVGYIVSKNQGRLIEVAFQDESSMQERRLA